MILGGFSCNQSLGMPFLYGYLREFQDNRHGILKVVIAVFIQVPLLQPNREELSRVGKSKYATSFVVDFKYVFGAL